MTTVIEKSNTVWCVTVETKHGADVVLLRQDNEPTMEDLMLIEDKFKKDYDLQFADASIECGSRDLDKLPCSLDEFLNDTV
tara:strand:+ start:906 stop:1148 length:243 start_codon:yes stop_codon:yes gene_type:complete